MGFQIDDFVFDPDGEEDLVWLYYPPKELMTMFGYLGRISCRRYALNSL